MLDFEICPFQNRHLEPNSGPVQVNDKSDKKCTFCAKFALRKKIGSITFSQFCICLNLARTLHINGKKLGGHSSCFKKKPQNRPKNCNFCTICVLSFHQSATMQ